MEELCALVEHVVNRLEQERQARGGDSSDDGELPRYRAPRAQAAALMTVALLAMALLARRAS